MNKPKHNITIYQIFEHSLGIQEVSKHYLISKTVKLPKVIEQTHFSIIGDFTRIELRNHLIQHRFKRISNSELIITRWDKNCRITYLIKLSLYDKDNGYVSILTNEYKNYILNEYKNLIR